MNLTVYVHERGEEREKQRKGENGKVEKTPTSPSGKDTHRHTALPAPMNGASISVRMFEAVASRYTFR